MAATNQKSYRNSGSFACNASATSYSVSAKIRDALELPPTAVARVNAINEAGGYNVLTFAKSGAAGKTWGVSVYVGGTIKILAAGLPDTAVVTVGGDQPGVHDSAVPSFRQFPSFRADDYLLTLSAADATGVFHITAEIQQ